MLTFREREKKRQKKEIDDDDDDDDDDEDGDKTDDVGQGDVSIWRKERHSFLQFFH